MLDAAGERRLEQHNDRAWLAWHIAALTRAKKLPPLRKLQARRRAPPQSWQQQKLAAAMWAAALGGGPKQKER